MLIIVLMAHESYNPYIFYTYKLCESFVWFTGPEPMDISTSSTFQACEIPSSDVTILEGHTSEVCDIVFCFSTP